MPGEESTAGVEVQGASAASFSAPMAGYFGICICRDGGRSGLNGLPSKTAQKWVLHEKRLRIF